MTKRWMSYEHWRFVYEDLCTFHMHLNKIAFSFIDPFFFKHFELFASQLFLIIWIVSHSRFCLSTSNISLFAIRWNHNGYQPWIWSPWAYAPVLLGSNQWSMDFSSPWHVPRLGTSRLLLDVQRHGSTSLDNCVRDIDSHQWLPNWTIASVTFWIPWVPWGIKQHMIVHEFRFWFWCEMIMKVDWIDDWHGLTKCIWHSFVVTDESRWIKQVPKY